MAAGLSLPTRAQLLELRRAGVTEYRRTIGDETILLSLRPLYRGRRPDEQMDQTRSCAPKWSHVNDQQPQPSLSRSQRRRRNKRMDRKLSDSISKIQSAVRGWLARTSSSHARSQITTVQSCVRKWLAQRHQSIMIQPDAPPSSESPWIQVKTLKQGTGVR